MNKSIIILAFLAVSFIVTMANVIDDIEEGAKDAEKKVEDFIEDLTDEMPSKDDIKKDLDVDLPSMDDIKNEAKDLTS